MTVASNKKRPLIRRISRPSPINSLDHDVLSAIFSSLDDCFDLTNCSLVCKTWSSIITKSKLVAALYYKQWQMGLVKGLCFEEMAFEPHRLALQQSRRINVDQWKVHTANNVDQCRKKNGLLLTGCRDKVMRLWSVYSDKCVCKFEGEYEVPLDYGHLVDYDFDESKIVGLVCSNSTKNSRICVWGRNGIISMTSVLYPSKDDKGAFPKGTCMRYCDPEAVVGCADGTVRFFDMYRSQWSGTRRMYSPEVPLTCLGLSDDDSRLLVLAGGGDCVTMSSGLLGEYSSAKLYMDYSAGYLRTLCYNPCSDNPQMVFAGSNGGYVYCWDLRTRRSLWNTRVSRHAVCSVQQLRNAASSRSTLVVGGVDGVLRLVDHNTGEVISRIVLDTGYCAFPSRTTTSFTTSACAPVQRLRGRRLSADAVVDDIPSPPITCVTVGAKKVITAHNRDYIRTWKFN